MHEIFEGKAFFDKKTGNLFRALGYTEKEEEKLTNASIYFDKMAEQQKEEW